MDGTGIVEFALSAGCADVEAVTCVPGVGCADVEAVTRVAWVWAAGVVCGAWLSSDFAADEPHPASTTAATTADERA